MREQIEGRIRNLKGLRVRYAKAVTEIEAISWQRKTTLWHVTAELMDLPNPLTGKPYSMTAAGEAAHRDERIVRLDNELIEKKEVLALLAADIEEERFSIKLELVAFDVALTDRKQNIGGLV